MLGSLTVKEVAEEPPSELLELPGMNVTRWAIEQRDESLLY